MTSSPIRQLTVWRTLSTGQKVSVGELVQNRQAVFFQYQASYLARFGNLSPYKLAANTALQQAPVQPHSGLHGVFADSLPDGWGLLLQDRIFRQQGLAPAQITAMDRLAFVGNKAGGALSYEPSTQQETGGTRYVLAELGLQAQALFEGQTDEVLQALITAGSSGGARPKAQLFFAANSFAHCRTEAQEGDEAWLVKFTSSRFQLGHEEGRCEAAYLQLASQLGLQPPQWQLLDAPQQSGARKWLATKRFDYQKNEHTPDGRLHLHSACGLLDADFRSPSLDYHELIKASGQLCQSPQAAQLQFRRALFNLFASNQDDHSKNWAFLQDDHGQWQPAPFYDITFSPHPYNEHATAYGGYGKSPSLATIQQLAASAGFADWAEARHCIVQIAEEVMTFSKTALELDIPVQTIRQIQSVLEQRYQENQALLSG